ncbi:MAG: DHA2 family efflux MFS transporter permease subunit, partial [Nitrospinota bacterium]|nr:DHA2 family efflux MFS transporter permease subunit [Nitrospinota bacterium]
ANFGKVRTFITCTLLFSAVSVLCGFASNFEMLVLFRILQGAMAGPMIPLSQSLLLRCYPEERRGTALSFWAMTTMIAPIVGPIMGGWITDNVGWPWIFYINGPIGVAAAFSTWSFLKERETPVTRKPVDKVGLALLVIGVGSMQMMFDIGNEHDWFSSVHVWILAITAAVGLSFFIAWELTEEHPVVDLSLFRDRNFSIGTLTLSMGFMVFFGGIVIFTLWLQTQMGYTASWAGLAASPTGILSLLVTPFVGILVHRMDARILGTIAFLVYAYTSFWQAGFNTDATFYDVAMPRFVLGAGMACLFVPMTTITFSCIPREKIASAAGVTNFCRLVAAGFGASLAVTIWNNRASLHQSRLVENVTWFGGPAADALDMMTRGGMETQTALAMMMMNIRRQAVMMATCDIYWISGVLFTIMLGLIWLTRRAPPHSAPAGPAKR